MAEAAFSEDGKYYSAISEDGRLRIWDTETNVLKQEYTPDLHLTSPPTCLQWITVGTSINTTPKGKRKSSISEQGTQCIALGTSSGKILIYSVAQGKVDNVLNEKKGPIQHKKVTGLDWNRKNGLYSCNKDNVVREWDLTSLSSRNKYKINIESRNKISIISAIKILPHSQETTAQYLITASWQLQMWCLHNSTATLIKTLGHHASQQALLTVATLGDRIWLIDGSQNERLLSFWDVSVTSSIMPQTNGEEPTPNKKQRRKSVTTEPSTVATPTYNFVLEDAPKMIDAVLNEDGETRLTLVAATRSGVVHFYTHMLNGASTKPVKPSLTIHVTTGDATPLPLQCCRLVDADLQLGYTSGAATVFEKITPNLSSKTQVIIRGKVKAKKVKQTNAQTNEVNKVRADDNKQNVTYVEPMGGVSRKRPQPGGKVEVPMEARLANLAIDAGDRNTAVNQNLTRLLMQGLQSKDRKILEVVLTSRERAVCVRTVSQLPAEALPALLHELATRAALKTSACASVCAWLGAVLRCHSALLLATMNSQNSDHLTQILATFTNRRSHLCQLLNLKGRLELALAQRAAAEAARPDQDPVIDYNDTSEEEMEADRQSASEESFDEDQFDADSDAREDMDASDSGGDE